jgi:hypothetical protein
VRIRIDNALAAHDLTEYLRRCDCVVEQAGTKTLRVDVRRLQLDSPSSRDCRGSVSSAVRAAERDWARMEVDAFLRIWRTRHPGVVARLVA